jgi:hypothetical protein
MDGVIPPLHDGGVQAALIAALPGAAPVTLPTLAVGVLPAALAVTDCGYVDVQVSGTPVSVIPMLSCTRALTDTDDPVLRRKEVVEDEFPRTFREMVWTGQVVNGSGCDVTPPAVAKTEVVPGMFAVATSWLSGALVPAKDRDTVVEVSGWPETFIAPQVNGPTVWVMSFVPEVPANANAS